MAEIPAALLAFIKQQPQSLPAMNMQMPSDPNAGARAMRSYNDKQSQQAADLIGGAMGNAAMPAGTEMMGPAFMGQMQEQPTLPVEATGLFEGASPQQAQQLSFAQNMIETANPMLQQQGIGALDDYRSAQNPMLNKPQYGGQVMFKDASGNLFFGTSVKQGGEVSSSMVAADGSDIEPVGQLQMVNSLGLTSAQATQKMGRDKQVQMQVQTHQKGIDDLTGQLTGMDAQDKVFADAEELLTTGNPSTGTIQNMFPSFSADTIRLQNIANRAGLSIIQNTTFGALSAGEMKLAMQTGMPTNLSPPDLLKWVQDTRAAKQKLKSELMNAISFMNTRDPTQAGYKNSQVEWQKERNRQLKAERDSVNVDAMSLDDMVNKYAD